jgi:hypothetical protein
MKGEYYEIHFMYKSRVQQNENPLSAKEGGANNWTGYDPPATSNRRREMKGENISVFLYKRKNTIFFHRMP